MPSIKLLRVRVNAPLLGYTPGAVIEIEDTDFVRAYLADGRLTLAAATPLRLPDPVISRDELEQALAGGAGVPATDTDREKYVPARLSAAELRAAYDAQAVIFYDDFSQHPDGALAGEPIIGGQAWLTTGTTPTTIVSGTAQATGTGYGWQSTEDPADDYVIEFDYAGSGTGQTLTIATSPTYNNLNDLLHFNLNPGGWDLSFRVGGVWSHTPASTVPLSGAWRRALKNGVRYRARLSIDGSTVSILGPFGESFSVTDDRIAALAGRHFFIEPVGSATGRYPRVHRLMAFRRVAANGPATALLASGPTSGFMVDNYGRIVGNRWTMWEVSVGRDPSQGVPAVTFGPTALSVSLTAAATVGGTTLTTDTPLIGGLTLIIDPGTADEETVTTSGNSSGSYLHTITALTKAHPIGTPVVCTAVPAARRSTIFWNPLNNFLRLPTQTYVDGVLYLGSSQDITVSRHAAGVVSFGGSGAGRGAIRPGSGPTTSRPAASLVGSSAIYFDTTLVKLVYSDGTNWRLVSDDTVA